MAARPLIYRAFCRLKKADPMLQAIQTFYRGHHFRSRTEARWAVFFDTLGIKWEYERQGYKLPSGAAYLPDFFVHAHDSETEGNGYWVEVKGDTPTPADQCLMQELCYASGHHGYIVQGLPGEFAPLRFTYHQTPPINPLDALRASAFVIAGAAMPLVPWFKQAVEDATASRFEHGQSGAPTRNA